MKSIISIFTALYVALMVSGCQDQYLSCIKLSQSANGSSGEHWKYELSCDNVLIEVGYETNSFMFGPVYEQQWTFAAGAPGEVTISWIAFESGINVVKSKCYSETYHVDNEGNIKCISSVLD